MEDRIEQYAMPEGGHRIPFRSYRLEAHPVADGRPR